MIEYCIHNGELYHFNPFHDNLGRFASSRMGRTYVSGDGRLTSKGKRRLNAVYEQTEDKDKNGSQSDGSSSGKKKKKDTIRIDKTGRVIPEDRLKASKTIHDEITKDYNTIGDSFKTASDISGKTVSLRDKIRSNRANKVASREDLSQMTNDDLNNYINRKTLEKRYRDVKASEVNRGRDRLDEVLEYGGAVLGIAASATAIAVAIHQLKDD